MRTLKVLLYLFLLCSSIQVAKAIDPLSVSENGHYLLSGGKPFFWFGDTQWFINRFTDEQIIKILDNSKEKGFNVIQVFAVRTWEKTWVGDHSWSKTDANGNYPFINGDPLKLNAAYWDRWGWIMDEVAKRDMYFLMLIGEPLRKDSHGPLSSLADCYEYGRLMGKYYRSKKNLIYSVSQDNPPTRSVFGVPGFDAVAEGLADGINGENNFNNSANYSTSFGTYHTHAFSSQWYHNKEWLDFNGVQGSRNEAEKRNNEIVYQRVWNDCLLLPVKPVVFLEGSYEMEPNHAGKLPPTTPRNVRMQFLYSFFAGGAGFSYGHFDNWGQYKSIDYLNSEGATQVSVISKFLRKCDWWKFIPDNSLIVSGQGEGEGTKVALRSDELSMVFFPEASSAVIKNPIKGKSVAYWFDPRNGGVVTVGKTKRGKEMELRPPLGWEDALLVIQKG